MSGPSAVAQRKDDKDKKPADGGLTAAQRQEAAPLARLADEVMKGTAPGTYLVTAKEPSKDKDAKDAPSQPAPDPVTLTLRQDFLKAQQGLIFVPFTVAVPWNALYAISSHATKEFYMYPDDMPPELLAAQTQRAALDEAPEPSGARAVLREVATEGAQKAESSDAPKEPPKRGHLRLVK